METFRRLSLPLQQCLVTGDNSFVTSETGALYACGKNQTGQLLLPDSYGYNVLTSVPVPEAVRSVASDGEKILVVTTSGEVYGAGDNSFAEDSLDYASILNGMVKISLPEAAKQVTVSDLTGYVVTRSCALYKCNLSSYVHQEYATIVAVPVPAPEPVSSVVTGNGALYIITVSGTLYGTGSNFYGQLGLGHRNRQDGFTRVQLPEPVKQIAAGHRSAFVVTTEGALYACGDNFYGQLGLRNKFTRADLQQRVSVVSVGIGTTYAVTETGELYACGQGYSGDYTFTQINLPEPVRTVAAAGYSALVATVNGALYAYGGNGYGQLGLGDIRNRSQFTLVTDTI